ncbi:MAG: hypothetical protein RL226_2005 [Bacteroidota bacterium]
MTRIGLISDTHSYLDDRIIHHLQDCDQIWHAGDIGSVEVSDKLAQVANLKAVCGNIDGHLLRRIHPLEQYFELEGFKILMIHIAGKPYKYAKGIPELIYLRKPDILVCGHSHILRVEKDRKYNTLYMNPGAAGFHGFHKTRTLMRFSLDKGQMLNMEVVELGPRLIPESEIK